MNDKELIRALRPCEMPHRCCECPAREDYCRMAKRLIDTEALWHRLVAEPWYNDADRGEVALPLVDEAPTVDAVEVVRCRDCKNYTNMDFFSGNRLDFHWCSKFRNITSEGDFCSYGERKGALSDDNHP